MASWSSQRDSGASVSKDRNFSTDRQNGVGCQKVWRGFAAPCFYKPIDQDFGTPRIATPAKQNNKVDKQVGAGE